MKPLISIILCTRNYINIPKINKQSIAKQTYSNIEIIISEGIKNNQIVRNEGFKKAKGELIFFCDEDIILKNTCIEELYNTITKGNYQFSYCNYQRAGYLHGIQYGKPFDIQKLKQNNYISTMSLISSEVFPGFDPKIRRLQDWDLFLTIVEKGGVGIWCDQILFTAMYKKGDISTQTEDNWENSFNIVKNKHKI